jgi:hypothetical protein
MIRTQIQLTEEQVRKLRRVARAQGLSMAEAIRRLIDKGIEDELPDRRALYARASRWIGAFRDAAGASDVSEAHDRYLDGAYG